MYYSCGHLYHASCLGVSARDGPSLGITCVVCNKGSAPSGHTGRLPLAVSKITLRPFSILCGKGYLEFIRLMYDDSRMCYS